MPKVAIVSYRHDTTASLEQLASYWAELNRIAQETGELTYISEDFKMMVAQTALLDEAGIQLENVGWNDPNTDWEAYSAIVIRSTWDYHYEAIYPQFLAWLDRIEHLPVWNAPTVIRWNSDKHYLKELQMLGVHIPPSVWVEKGESANIAKIMREKGWHSAIAKPCIGAGAHGLLRYDNLQSAEAGQAEFASASAHHALLVQALIPQITTEGELSLIFYMGADGTPHFSHALRKVPPVGDIRVQAGDNTPYVPSDDLITQAKDMIAAAQSLFHTPFLYVRVDAVLVEGALMLMELELIEPYFFLTHMDDVAPTERFIRALQVILG